MRRTIALAVIGASLAACTVQQEGTELKQEFHPPLTYATWKTERYTSQDGKPVCAVTSGHNGVSLQLRRGDGGDVAVSARGNRSLPPGAFLSVSVNRHFYQTAREFFPTTDAVKLADDLAAGGKAYLEWSEIDHHGRLRSSNIIKLDGFKLLFEQCRKEAMS